MLLVVVVDKVLCKWSRNYAGLSCNYLNAIKTLPLRGTVAKTDVPGVRTRVTLLPNAIKPCARGTLTVQVTFAFEVPAC